MGNEGKEISVSGLNVRTEREDDIGVVVCSGRLTAENASALKDLVKGMIPHETRLLMDMGEVTRMDSAGLGALVGIYVSAKHADCELVLANMSKPVRDLLGISQLLSIFEACGKFGTRMG
jgi:anti-sigma B factor antagonist